jgi:hypothetical protein
VDTLRPQLTLLSPQGFEHVAEGFSHPHSHCTTLAET